MKTTALAATLALVVGLPIMASAAETVAPANAALMTAGQEITLQPGDAILPAAQPSRPRHIGPYVVRHGLLPNGLMPNPFTYG